MTTVEISGWERAFSKSQHTQLLQKLAGMSLTQAKSTTDAVLEGQSVSIMVTSDDTARELVAELSRLGAKARIIVCPSDAT